MSIHIEAEKGAIAKTVLVPGDPLRAKFVAENFLEDHQLYNQVRGMLGYTGSYKGTRVSVQGSGMGQPSLSIYVNELIKDYGVEQVIRIGSCGSYQKDLNPRDVILAIGACTDSSLNASRFANGTFAPTPSFRLLRQAYDQAQALGIPVTVGNVFSGDAFYAANADEWKLWASYGVLAAEMETAELYTLSAQYGVDALSVLTVSDSLVTGESLDPEAREKTFTDMMKIALSLA